MQARGGNGAAYKQAADSGECSVADDTAALGSIRQGSRVDDTTLFADGFEGAADVVGFTDP